ncbi:MAG: UspA domain protein [Verrucomicrobiales bacterium]|nr:UspA domain protein [Verrucomicrobiales bacterium]
MYHRILVALENSKSDRSLMPHVKEMAKRFNSKLVLLHVADGYAARNFNSLNLAESEEIRADKLYLEKIAGEMKEGGIASVTRLAMGSPPKEILRVSVEEKCDLIAMTTHGHRWFADAIFGSTISDVRHKSIIPLLVVRDISS